MACKYSPNNNRLGPWNILFIVAAIGLAITAICTGWTFYLVQTTIFTECYPIGYRSEVGIREEITGTDSLGLPEEEGPYPVKAWVEYLYYNKLEHVNKTITYQNVCGNTLQNALDRAKESYPYMTPILCGWKESWFEYKLYPVIFFRNGMPWNQIELLISSGFCLIVVFVVYLVLTLFRCEKRTVPDEETLALL